MEDVAYIIEKLITRPQKINAPFRILNVGKGSQTKLTDYLKEIEKFSIKGKINLLPYKLEIFMKLNQISII